MVDNHLDTNHRATQVVHTLFFNPIMPDSTTCLSASFTSWPSELIGTILQYLPLSDLHSLLRVSRLLFAIVARCLYDTVHLQSSHTHATRATALLAAGTARRLLANTTRLRLDEHYPCVCKALSTPIHPNDEYFFLPRLSTLYIHAWTVQKQNCTGLVACPLTQHLRPRKLVVDVFNGSEVDGLGIPDAIADSLSELHLIINYPSWCLRSSMCYAARYASTLERITITLGDWLGGALSDALKESFETAIDLLAVNPHLTFAFRFDESQAKYLPQMWRLLQYSPGCDRIVLSAVDLHTSVW